MSEVAAWGRVESEEYQEVRAMAGAWPRFWSRSVDIAMWSWPLGYIMGLLFPSFALWFALTDNGGNLFGLALLPLIMVVDALCLAFLGNTLGRAIAGIRVETIRHERVPVTTALTRSALVYLKGLGLGIPFVALFTQISNYKKVNSGEQTSWDEDLYTRVYDVSSNIFRTSVCAVLVVTAIAAPKIMDELDRQERRTKPNYDPTPLVDPVEKQLRDAAAEIKPQIVDEVTRLESAEAEGRTFTYNYSIIRRDASDEAFGKFFVNHIQPKVCADDSTRPLLRDYQITYRYSYMMPNATTPLVYEVSWEDCSS